MVAREAGMLAVARVLADKPPADDSALGGANSIKSLRQLSLDARNLERIKR